MGAIAGLEDQSQKRLEEMLATMEHRGSAQRQIHQDSSYSIGVIAAGISGMRGNGFARKNGTVVLFDGEIYNEREPGGSDADVVLNLYETYGHTFANHLQGAFACAILDGDELLLARDAVGIRPLYWGRTAAGELCFSSELKALVGLAEAVQEMLPATLFSSRCGVSNYIPQHPDVRIPGDAVAATSELRRILFSAVERRLADGGVGGCFLSGGLDSSVIAAIANELQPGLQLFTVGTEDAPDMANAKIMAKHLGLEQNLHVLTYGVEEVVRDLRDAVYTLESFDEDCIMGTAANMIASAFAGQHTNCMLSGEGGDELFGGYHLLKDLPSDTARLSTMNKLISISYNTALQRLDRAMMSHGIHYRTPFLDSEVIAFALQLPVSWKVHAQGERLVEKWILREAFKDLLPDTIYLREKLRFSCGSGTENFLQEAEESLGIAGEFGERERRTECGYELNSRLELGFYRVFKERFPGAAFENLVGRWDPNK